MLLTYLSHLERVTGLPLKDLKEKYKGTDAAPLIEQVEKRRDAWVALNNQVYYNRSGEPDPFLMSLSRKMHRTEIEIAKSINLLLDLIAPDKPQTAD